MQPSKFPNLTHDNYHEWCGFMLAALTIARVDSAVTGIVDPAASEFTAGGNDRLARAHLRMHISEPMWLRVASLKTAKEIWEYYAAMHAQTGLASLARFDKELSCLEQVEGESVNHYFDRALRLQGNLRLAGTVIDDAQLIAKLLAGFRPEFEALVRHLELGTVTSLQEVQKLAIVAEGKEPARSSRPARRALLRPAKAAAAGAAGGSTSHVAALLADLLAALLVADLRGAGTVAARATMRRSAAASPPGTTESTTLRCTTLVRSSGWFGRYSSSASMSATTRPGRQG